MIQDERHTDINGIVIVHVLQRYHEQRIVHIHIQNKQSQRRSMYIIRRRMRMMHGQIVQQRQRHGRT